MPNVSRRRFLESTLAAGAALALPGCALRLGGGGTRLVDLDAWESAERVRRGELTPTELVEAAIARIERTEPVVRAIVTPFPEHALELAATARRDAPFAGVPYLIKDLSDYAGFRTARGSRAFVQYVSPETSPYIEAAVRAGFLPLGKSATPEFGALPTTEPLAFESTRNPWNLEYSAGGSSGGAGAAVAAGMVPCAQASDGGGSIRIPASNCGLFGLKVTRGRNVGAMTGPLALPTNGCISWTVRDTAAHLAVTEQPAGAGPLAPVGLVAGPSGRARRIGLVLIGTNGQGPTPEVEAAVRDTAALCESLGHHVEEVTPPETATSQGDALMDYTSGGLAVLADRLAQGLGRAPDEREFEPWLLGQIAHRRALSPERIAASEAFLKRQAADVRAMFDTWDVLLMPVLGTRPAKLGWLRSSPDRSFRELLERSKRYVAYTTLFNVSGNPAMSVPLHWTDDGLPIGSQLAAAMGDERTLLELAYELEAARPWRPRKAPHSAWNL